MQPVANMAAAAPALTKQRYSVPATTWSANVTDPLRATVDLQ